MLRVIVTFLIAMTLAGCAALSDVERQPVDVAEMPYRLDSGDTLRVVVFEQASLSNTYQVDGGGRISMPLIGPVQARGRTTQELENAIAAALRDGYLRDPSVSVQVETYRPFFILGEVAAPGQYPYVAGMTAETAVAIAGGFTPRAVKAHARVTRRVNGRMVETRVPITFPVSPGDTIHIAERWF